MAGIVGNIYQRLTTLTDFVMSCFPQPKDIMVETSPFGPSEWKKHFGIEVAHVEVPNHLQIKWDQSCAFWQNKKVKETHLLCLIPDLAELNKLDASSSLKLRIDKFKPIGHMTGPYWVLISKEPIPGTEGIEFDQQRELLSKKGYDAPYFLEVTVAVLAAKFQGQYTIFPGEGRYSKCYEIYQSLLMSDHIAVGGDSGEDITVDTHDGLRNGVAGVLR